MSKHPPITFSEVIDSVSGQSEKRWSSGRSPTITYNFKLLSDISLDIQQVNLSEVGSECQELQWEIYIRQIRLGDVQHFRIYLRLKRLGSLGRIRDRGSRWDLGGWVEMGGEGRPLGQKVWNCKGWKTPFISALLCEMALFFPSLGRGLGGRDQMPQHNICTKDLVQCALPVYECLCLNVPSQKSKFTNIKWV